MSFEWQAGSWFRWARTRATIPTGTSGGLPRRLADPGGPDALKRRLAQAAHRRGQPEAALIRAAIERLLEEEARPRPTLPLFRSGDPTLAERVDEALAGFGE